MWTEFLARIECTEQNIVHTTASLEEVSEIFTAAKIKSKVTKLNAIKKIRENLESTHLAQWYKGQKRRTGWTIPSLLFT